MNDDPVKHSMSFPRPEARFLATWLIGWCLLCFGCVPPKVHVQAAPQFDPSAISSVAVLPFQALQTPQWRNEPTTGVLRDPEEIRTQFRLPGTDHMRVSESRRDRYTVSPTAANRITSRVVAVLGRRPSLRVIGPSDSFLPTLGQGGEDLQTSFKRLAQEVGTRLQVDGVMMGLVRTYREREGTKMGATPAAVGFEIFLVRPLDGAVLWKGDFFEEQKPLTQDIVGFFEKGGGFVTVEELAELGVQKVMAKFPVGLVAGTSSPPSVSSSENP